MRKNSLRIIKSPFNFTKNPGVKTSFIVLVTALTFSACNWTTGVFEKDLTFRNHEWPASVKPDISFDITDTISSFNIYIVIRHTDAFHFNNMFVRVTVREPNATQGKTGDYDLQLASNGSGWIGTAMDDIYDARLLIQPKTRFSKTGTYHMALEQLMREDPLKNVLSAGIRIERVE
jgi:gliding motility-associated lipoprotein GldH